MEEVDVQLKIVILGNPDVGKSSILRRYVTGECSESTENTIGAKFMAKVININNKLVRMNIWDTAGQERYQSFSKLYCRDAGALILVYDVMDIESFEGMKKWYEVMAVEVLPLNTLLFVVGNKFDQLQTDHPFIYEVQEYTDWIKAEHFQVSAKSGLGINELFTKISAKYLENTTFNKRSSIFLKQNSLVVTKKKKKFC